MHRRSLLQGSFLAAFMPFASNAKPPAQEEVTACTLFFLDGLYQLPLAASAMLESSGTRILSVTADITAVWQQQRQLFAAGRPLVLGGITAESFRFCLHRLLQDSHHLNADSDRIDRDFVAWTLTSTDSMHMRRG